MQKFLIALLSPIIEKLFKGIYIKISDGIKKANQIRKDRKLLKDIKKHESAKVRAKRLKDYFNK